MVQTLLKEADIDVRDGSEQTALHWAAVNGHETVVRLLLEKDADPAAKEKSQETH